MQRREQFGNRQKKIYMAEGKKKNNAAQKMNIALRKKTVLYSTGQGKQYCLEQKKIDLRKIREREKKNSKQKKTLRRAIKQSCIRHKRDNIVADKKNSAQVKRITLRRIHRGIIVCTE